MRSGGRPVAIDWALSKAHYLSHRQHGDDHDDESDTNSEASSNAELESDADAMMACEAAADVDDDEDMDSEAEGLEPDQEDVVDHDEARDSTPPEGRNSARGRSRPSRDVQEQRTVFVRNVPFEAREPLIQELFSRFGQVKSVMIVMDRVSGGRRSRGSCR